MLGFIGAGNMGGAILQGVIDTKLAPASSIVVSCSSTESTSLVATRTGATPASSNRDLVSHLGRDGIVILAVKPHLVPRILDDIRDVCAEMNTVLVSVAAGVSLDTLASHCEAHQPIVRTMPNVAASIGQSMTALCPNTYVSDEQYADVVALFEAIGSTIRIAEKDFSAYSAIAGCSPAFSFYYIDALARGAVQAGLTKKDAVAIAAQAVRGAASMVLAGLNDATSTPAALADSVQSPGGTTIAGVVAMEDAGFSAAIVRGVQASIARDKELGAA